MTMMEQTKKDMKEMGKAKYISLCVVTTLLLLALVGGLAAIVTLSAKPATNDYAMTCKVVELDDENDLVVLVDANGFEWAWEGIEDWQVGDCASLLMNDNGTAEIFDDIILSMHYNSWGLS